MAMSPLPVPPPIASFNLIAFLHERLLNVVEHAARGGGCSCFRRGCGSEIEELRGMRDTRRRPGRWGGDVGCWVADEGVSAVVLWV